MNLSVEGQIAFEDFLIVGSFLPFGVGAVLCNAIIILAVRSHPFLRQRREYQIITALAFADFIEGFATMFSAIFRLGLLLSSHADAQLLPLQCMLLPQSWLWRWSDAATATMLVVVSVDRLISVLFPIRYFRLGASYASIMIGMSYTYSLVSSLFAWIHPLTDWTPVSALCMTRDFTSLAFYQYSKYTTSVASLLSVVIYLPLIVAMRQQLHFISTRISFTQETAARTSLYFFHLTKINSMINLLLLYVRHHNMRCAINRLFRAPRPKHQKKFFPATV